MVKNATRKAMLVIVLLSAQTVLGRPGGVVIVVKNQGPGHVQFCSYGVRNRFTCYAGQRLRQGQSMDVLSTDGSFYRTTIQKIEPIGGCKDGGLVEVQLSGGDSADDRNRYWLAVSGLSLSSRSRARFDRLPTLPRTDGKYRQPWAGVDQDGDDELDWVTAYHECGQDRVSRLANAYCIELWRQHEGQWTLARSDVNAPCSAP